MTPAEGRMKWRHAPAGRLRLSSGFRLCWRGCRMARRSVSPADSLPAWSGKHIIGMSIADPRATRVATMGTIFPKHDWRIRAEWLLSCVSALHPKQPSGNSIRYPSSSDGPLRRIRDALFCTRPKTGRNRTSATRKAPQLARVMWKSSLGPKGSESSYRPSEKPPCPILWRLQYTALAQ